MVKRLKWSYLSRQYPKQVWMSQRVVSDASLDAAIPPLPDMPDSQMPSF